jgi:hypothetical protein
VIEFAFELARGRQFAGEKLAALAQRLADADNPAGAEKLKSEITRGFYGI